MTDLQLYPAVGLPVIAVLTSLVVSLVQISGIRGELTGIRKDLREIRSDVKLLTGKVCELMAK